jgi:glycerate 2-kinase
VFNDEEAKMGTRVLARNMFLEALKRANLQTAMTEKVRVSLGVLLVCDRSFDLRIYKDVILIAVGKAATPMSEWLIKTLQPELRPQQLLRGIVIGGPPQEFHRGFSYFPGDHPIPGENSFKAGRSVLATLSEVRENTLVLYLISGGASAMLEAPLDPNISVADTASFYRAIIHSGLAIQEINILRKHFSAVKGGRLAVLASKATQYTLLISDVPEGMLHMVGSGPSLPDPTTIADCRRILQKGDLLASIPRTIARLFDAVTLAETPKTILPHNNPMPCCSLLSSETLLRAAASIAKEKGFHVVVDNTCDDWDLKAASAYLLDRFAQLRRDHGRVCLLTAGELTLEMRGDTGVGGRNQHFALETARHISDMQGGIAILSAGSDGIDGNSRAAGAVVDETSWRRAVRAGLDPEKALKEFDSYRVFSGLDDVIVTGETGNNIRDLRLFLTISQ